MSYGGSSGQENDKNGLYLLISTWFKNKLN